jgi:hypothetical protein
MVLYATGKLRSTIYLYEGKCKVCNKLVKIKSIEPQDHICIQCQYHINYQPRD